MREKLRTSRRSEIFAREGISSRMPNAEHDDFRAHDLKQDAITTRASSDQEFPQVDPQHLRFRRATTALGMLLQSIERLPQSIDPALTGFLRVLLLEPSQHRVNIGQGPLRDAKRVPHLMHVGEL